MILRKFYIYRRYCYAFAALCMLSGFVISWKLSADTRKDLESRLSILPAPVYSADREDLDTVTVEQTEGRATVTNEGPGVIYMAELTDGEDSFVYDKEPLEPGKQGTVILPEGAGKVSLRAVGIDRK
ncbi:MAG: hypothetical protein IK083_00795 [Abditibacteriota bacterium]|nr:hypothetical protein [Abditibacteriota bacterium]